LVAAAVKNCHRAAFLPGAAPIADASAMARGVLIATAMRRPLVCPAVLTAFLTLAIATARADQARGPAAPPPGSGEWYGWKVLMADGAVIAATLSCVDLGWEDPCWVPAFGYFLTGPIVHGLHRGTARTFASVGFRVMLPIVGAAIGKAIPDCYPDTQDGNCGIGEMLLGGAIGIGVAMTIDAVWAFGNGEAGQPPQAVARKSGFSALPTLSLTARGAGIGFAGRF
jgi:hypothetical protein